jgi:chromosome partitioning protein
MISILVANIKGGCGKSTVATQLAGAFAAAGHTTALADVDSQRSSLGWIKRRPVTVAPISALDWTKEIGDAPSRITRLVIDAPAAMKKGAIEDLVRQADFIVLPVLPSAFDEGATTRFLSRLDDLKPIRRNRKPVAVLGNRMKPRSKASAELDRFLEDVGHKVVARLRDSAAYAELARDGLSLFDLRSPRAKTLREDWAPLLAFLEGGSGG